MHNIKISIFPREVSDKVQQLNEYPNFGSLIAKGNVRHFCLYMDEVSKIKFQKRRLTQNVINTIYSHGKESKMLNDFRPNDINWSSVVNRWKRPAVEGNRKNADIRTGFRVGCDFLVKAYFTFGQRTVPSDRAHVYQTLDVPLLLFLRGRRAVNIDLTDDGYFPYETLCHYDRRIIPARTCVRIPQNTTYFIFAVQKTFFRMNVVYANYKIPFQFSDPVKTIVTKVAGMYDEPAPTPYVEDVEREEEDLGEGGCCTSSSNGTDGGGRSDFDAEFERMLADPPPVTVNFEEFYDLMQPSRDDDGVFLRPQPPPPPAATAAAAAVEQMAVGQQQAATYILIHQNPIIPQQQQVSVVEEPIKPISSSSSSIIRPPSPSSQPPTISSSNTTDTVPDSTPLPILERNVVVVSAGDFIERYNRLKYWTIETGPASCPALGRGCWNDEDFVPLDLCVRKGREEEDECEEPVTKKPRVEEVNNEVGQMDFFDEIEDLPQEKNVNLDELVAELCSPYVE